MTFDGPVSILDRPAYRLAVAHLAVDVMNTEAGWMLVRGEITRRAHELIALDPEATGTSMPRGMRAAREDVARHHLRLQPHAVVEGLEASARDAVLARFRRIIDYEIKERAQAYLIAPDLRPERLAILAHEQEDRRDRGGRRLEARPQGQPQH